MTMDPDTEAQEHTQLERRRDMVIGRLSRIVGALDRRRHAVQDAVTDLVPGGASTGRVSTRAKVLAGLALGAGLFALGMLTQGRIRARRSPLRRLGRLLGELRPRSSPLASFAKMVGRAVGSFAANAASDAMHTMSERLLSGPEPPVPVDPDDPRPAEPENPPGTPPGSPIEPISGVHQANTLIAPVAPPLTAVGTLLR